MLLAFQTPAANCISTTSMICAVVFWMVSIRRMIRAAAKACLGGQVALERRAFLHCGDLLFELFAQVGKALLFRLPPGGFVSLCEATL
jgi:hypothetical protein